MEIIFLILVILGLGSGATTFVIKNLYYICQPSEILIFAGPKKRTATGREVGYRLVKGSASLRVPLLERALRMDLTNMIIELHVANAYSKGGIPLKVDGVANIKIAGDEPTIHNAIERLLGKSRKEIEQIAKELLEGNLRGVLATLTPEQVNEDKIAFARSLLDEAEEDLESLGLILDTLQIQNISDDVRYLDSIGRKQQADLLRDARIAEAEASAESAIETAENEKITALKRIDRDIAIARAEAKRRIEDATTMRGAVVAEAEADIASALAKTQAELPVQQERIKQVRQQLQADIIAPAEAESKRAIAYAKGEAAQIIEDGKALAEGTESLAASWNAAGPNARDIFVLQKLEVLLKTLTSTIPQVKLQNVTVIDAERGGTAIKAASFIEQIKQTTGVDLAGAVQKLAPSPGEATSLQAGHSISDQANLADRDLPDRS
ncbi:flotillin family protein [Lyngbya confervoides]|uniref:SPFH domain-containing protein n=1 Tax=Lyngbya confervoides BDU141951 TaxID=1574623 RepID=A0ABD4T2C1_9CYAN|nr:SPFH domain-containing protein [Lyngbya confervoides]MCM1982541.1 SPFH domain-containing protein [Lyngbya confervoides BDU141951]